MVHIPKLPDMTGIVPASSRSAFYNSLSSNLRFWRSQLKPDEEMDVSVNLYGRAPISVGRLEFDDPMLYVFGRDTKTGKDAVVITPVECVQIVYQVAKKGELSNHHKIGFKLPEEGSPESTSM
jgi:hypothetical protein